MIDPSIVAIVLSVIAVVRVVVGRMCWRKNSLCSGGCYVEEPGDRKIPIVLVFILAMPMIHVTGVVEGAHGMLKGVEIGDGTDGAGDRVSVNLTIVLYVGAALMVIRKVKGVLEGVHALKTRKESECTHIEVRDYSERVRMMVTESVPHRAWIDAFLTTSADTLSYTAAAAIVLTAWNYYTGVQGDEIYNFMIKVCVKISDPQCVGRVPSEVSYHLWSALMLFGWAALPLAVKLIALLVYKADATRT
jgi:hypothetical protein